MQAVMLTKKGGPEVLETVELPMPEPGPGEVRVKVRATGVGATDVTMRRSSYPYAPPIPFVPGYESIGIVDAVGAGVTTLKEGERVCALLVHGGYATHVVRGAEHWVKVPDDLDDVQAVALILNYATAFQMIHRKARLQPGQSALVNAANGGVGQALLDLLRAQGVSAIGAAAKVRHDIVKSYGATPIEGRSGPLDVGVHAVRAEGVDAAFDGVGGVHTGQCVSSTRRGGITVWYGFTGAQGFPRSCGQRCPCSWARGCGAGAGLSMESPCYTGRTLIPSSRTYRSYLTCSDKRGSRRESPIRSRCWTRAGRTSGSRRAGSKGSSCSSRPTPIRGLTVRCSRRPLATAELDR